MISGIQDLKIYSRADSLTVSLPIPSTIPVYTHTLLSLLLSIMLVVIMRSNELKVLRSAPLVLILSMLILSVFSLPMTVSIAVQSGVRSRHSFSAATRGDATAVWGIWMRAAAGGQSSFPLCGRTTGRCRSSNAIPIRALATHTFYPWQAPCR